MALTMYDSSIPVMMRGLGILTEYLDKAQAYVVERKLDPNAILLARLAPDMMTFAAQIQRASDNSKMTIHRLAGIAVPSFPDTETTFEELHERLAKTQALLASVTPEQLAGSEDLQIDAKFLSAQPISGQRYLLSFLLPNLFFHVTTAHDILRHNGVKLGKLDYIGAF